MVPTKKWLYHKLHTTNLAMESITFTTCEVVGPPPIEHNLEPLASALCWIGNHLSLSQVTTQEAP